MSLTDTGYGRKRLLFWPWHYIQHVRRGIPNGYSRVPYGTGASGSAWAPPRLFCTWCVDVRLRAFYIEERSIPCLTPPKPERRCERGLDAFVGLLPWHQRARSSMRPA